MKQKCNMNNKIIIFNKEGYDPFIDFVKAYAIICVLIGHTTFPFVHYAGYGLWAGMQVPLFILVQTFHFYKRKDSQFSIKKIINRIVLPFLFFWAISFLFFVLSNKDVDAISLLIKGVRNGGGYGPGSYYPLIYIQIALLLPLFRIFLNKNKKKELLYLFLIISEGMEILCSLTQPPEWVYRILAVRYVFLVYLGWLWVNEGVKLDWTMILLSIFSMMSIVYFEYVSPFFPINNEPFFFTTAWSFHRWPCYYYVSNALVFILYFFYQKFRTYDSVNRCIKVLAKSSYEIFLVQMTCIPILDTYHLRFIIRFILVWVVSILGGVLVNYICNKSHKSNSLVIK